MCPGIRQWIDCDVCGIARVRGHPNEGYRQCELLEGFGPRG